MVGLCHHCDEVCTPESFVSVIDGQLLRYKEIDPSVTVPIPDFDMDANAEHHVSNTDEELERGATEGFRDWNRRIVPAMMGKKLSEFFLLHF